MISRKFRTLAIAAALTLVGGASLAQQSTIGGKPARPRFTSVGVGQAAPAGTGNLTATGTVTAGTVNATTALQINGVPVTFGSYTPTLTNVSNVAASTMFAANWMRVGNVVTVAGNMQIDPTAAADTSFRLNLPVASNLSSNGSLGGAGTANDTTARPAVYVIADGINDAVNFLYIATSINNVNVSYTYTYIVQ